MNGVIAIALGLAVFTVASAQGTVLIQNYLGATISYIDATVEPLGLAKGESYKVQVFTFTGLFQSPFGTQVGPTIAIDSEGRFSAGAQTVPGVAAGAKATLIVRAWDSRTGVDYDSAQIRGHSTAFITGVLGGVGNPPSPPSSMVSGLPTGFMRFAVMPEPTTVALGAIAAASLFIRLRK